MLCKPDIHLLLLFLCSIVRVYLYSSGKLYLLAPDACYKMDVRRLFGLGFPKIEIASDFVYEKLCIHKVGSLGSFFLRS